MQISPPVPSNVGSATASKFQFNLIPKVVFDVRSAAKRTLERRGFLPDALDEALKEVQEVADLVSLHGNHNVSLINQIQATRWRDG